MQWWTIIEALLTLAMGTPALRCYVSHVATIVAGYASLIAEWHRLLRALPIVGERRRLLQALPIIGEGRRLLPAIVAAMRHCICRRRWFFFHCYTRDMGTALRLSTIIDCRNSYALLH